MKNKFLVLTLCFTLFFSSINYKKSYADFGTLSLPVLGTVCSLAVGAGIIVSSNDDLYNLGSLFDKYNKLNDMTFDALKVAFEGVKVLGSGLVSVNSKFLDYCKGFFDFVFNNEASVSALNYPYYIVYKGVGECVGESLVYYCNGLSMSNSYPSYYGGCIRYKYINGVYSSTSSWSSGTIKLDRKYYVPYSSNVASINEFYDISDLGVTNAISGSFDYQGGYNWDNVESKKDNDSISLPIPGNLGTLVGQSSTDFWDNTDNLVGTGSLSIPSVSNPSISVDTSVDSFVGSADSDVPDVDTGVGSPSLPSLPSWGSGLDFSPITQGVFTDKFPFCLAKDVGDIISVFDVEPKAPVFKIPLVSEELTIDLTEFELWFDIMRFFILIGFIISLIVLTRGIIG